MGPNPTGDTSNSRTTYVICDMTDGLIRGRIHLILRNLKKQHKNVNAKKQ